MVSLRSIAKVAVLTLALAPLMQTATAADEKSPFKNAKAAVHYRHSTMDMISTNFSYLAGVVKGEREFEQQQVLQRAQAVNSAAMLMLDGFEYQGKEFTDGSKARSEIWQKWDEFLIKSDDLQQASIKLTEAAQANDPQALKMAVADAGQTCKSCHRSFKKR